ncbi:hypothetical protein [Streptomyces viridochromogenes]|uniref:hypothetical protein n=1 Tax=Streptomyces viridochromogenes TaxID=1938 RepID=UPI00069E0309|nr:hypothetical protein [Streptomyces viridochromogenes]KOG26793.1 hypothetical protein ADK36_02205 [Streptomyces viridochromogenes]
MFRLHLPMEFATKAEALDWFDGLRRSESIPAEAELYEPDALDKDRLGITSRDLIVRRVDERAEHMAVRSQLRRPRSH